MRKRRTRRWPTGSLPPTRMESFGAKPNLDKGLYKLIITAEGLSPSYYLLRVQQIDYSKLARKAVGPLTGLLLLALVAYELSKSGRVRSWWTSRRT